MINSQNERSGSSDFVKPPVQIYKKTNGRLIVNQTNSNDQLGQESLALGSVNNLNVIVNDSVQQTNMGPTTQQSYASVNFFNPNLSTGDQLGSESSLRGEPKYNSTQFVNAQHSLKQKALKINRTFIPHIQLDKKGQQVVIGSKVMRPRNKQDSCLIVSEQSQENISQSEIQL